MWSFSYSKIIVHDKLLSRSIPTGLGLKTNISYMGIFRKNIESCSS